MSKKKIAKRTGVQRRVQAAKQKALLKVDFGCGTRKEEGWTGIDIAQLPNVDIVHDLLKFPWPLKDESVSEGRVLHYLEHVPAGFRFAWMDELYRVLVVGGKCFFQVPYWSSMRCIQDPTHEWPPFSETSFLYFNAEWRKVNQVDHYPVKCDFDFTYGYVVSPMWASRNDETRQFAVQNYVNAAWDLQITMTKREPKKEEPKKKE